MQYFGKTYGKTLIAVAPVYTSQDCSACGNTVKKTLSTRTHICGCGAVLDRDHNASRNIWATRVEASRNHFKYGGAHRN
ncbi:MAG: transposase [Microcoleus sp. T1-bin1]|nr:transposase [Microcoleus sp. T1-bin1]